ncbi:hypothetical protein AB0D38_28780, partial [Streptomyces sp. NPDC048279]|uniref:hypothetical protein n=1 Tax=Streptomyces sp. NPDC048279 TaxID=3154714 RepID=UPI00343812EA
ALPTRPVSNTRRVQKSTVTRSREAAENADRAAYADARSEYAALGRDQLRVAALHELTAGARG